MAQHSTQPAAYAPQVMARCSALGEISEEAGRLTRRFATPALEAAMLAAAAWMRGAGMTVRRDNIGNLIGRYEADRPGAKTLLLGSHLDTVRDAGRYDGPLGILVALACVQQLADSGTRLPFAIEIVAFADEEGVRYHTAYLGSKAFIGQFDAQLLASIDEDGISLSEAIRRAGGDPAALARDARASHDLLGYCEVHIEQGPVLEALDLPVGVVTSIAGQSRFALSFSGAAGHAGTVPMRLRHDALCAAAEFVLLTEALACETKGLVATVGQLWAAPGASNVIPGHVTLSLDVRHQDDGVRLAAIEYLRQQAADLAERRGVALEWEKVQENPCVPCDGALTAQLERAIEACGLRAHALPSGAGHDGAILASAMPIAMLFVRCAGGISHNPAESVREEDAAAAIEVLAAMLAGMARTRKEG
ncbi:allantoate amidohydrolase [Chloroflexia bacterium SDU3-3]|nr:allantoate amidohydrolase [Chloroflexia bacterium SDU3-3]